MTGKVVVLTGGVGGSKFVDGLARLGLADELVAIVNTGDDFTHLGLFVSPDIDTLLYTLSGQADPVQGWGRVNESWEFMKSLESLGGEGWFRLGDGDLALHVLRTRALAQGSSLSEITDGFARSWGIGLSVLPMTDNRVSTVLETDEGVLAFQHYFVRRRCEPLVTAIRFDAAAASTPAPGVLEALASPATRAILIAPSNPFLSIDPILAVPGIREALAEAGAPVVAVSPLIGGKAVKGPTAKIMAELEMVASASAVQNHYSDFVDGMLVDENDPPESFTVPIGRADILMKTATDRIRVAAAALQLADRLSR